MVIIPIVITEATTIIVELEEDVGAVAAILMRGSSQEQMEKGWKYTPHIISLQRFGMLFHTMRKSASMKRDSNIVPTRE